jgi:uncharacterized protein YgiM (DUF1202 family)
MTAFAPHVLVLLTLALLAACAPEVKQPAQVGSQTDQAQPAAPAPGTAPGSTATTPSAPPPAGAPTRPAPTPEREAPPTLPADAPKRLIISVGHANLREKPDGKSRILQVLAKGAKLAVVSNGNQWYRVRIDNGREGWVAESVVTPSPD